jgi:galactose-1-phosphate uridylyltransferase
MTLVSALLKQFGSYFVGSNNNTQIVGKYKISFVRALETGR